MPNFKGLIIQENNWIEWRIHVGNERNRAMKDLIKRIVQVLVDHPEQIEVSEVKSDHITVLELRVAKEDIGKVIGKQGRTAQAIRTILRAASGKAKKHIIFDILEWSRGEKGPKIQDLQTKSLIILVWWCGLIKAKHREFKTSLGWNKIIQDIVWKG